MSVAYTKSGDPAVIGSDFASEKRALAGSEQLTSLTTKARPSELTGHRLLAVQALCLLARVDRDLLEARAQWNQDWFRRLMRARPRVVARVFRRWARISPSPRAPLGRLRRRYHANLARYLYEPRT